jgi:hypothetical protein
MSEEQQEVYPESPEGDDAGPAGPFVTEEQDQADDEGEFDGVQFQDPDEDDSDSDEEVTTGGELDHSGVSVPLETPPTKTHSIFNKDYKVTPEAGYRRS